MAAILLSGFGAEPLDGKPDTDDADFFELLASGDEGVVSMFQNHAPWLRSEAERYGIAPAWKTKDGRPLFYAEYVAWTRKWVL
jgi:hypothetical protein